MSLNTLRTTIGYVGTLLRKFGVLKLASASVEQIYNHVPISKNLSTSGQPSALELQKLKAAEFNTVINLAPHGVENSLDDEARIVTDLGLKYIHIPVDFRNPTRADFLTFVDAMSSLAGSEVWVHCAANMRVSAFVDRYRREILKEDEDAARKDLRRVWEPFEVWKSFVYQDHDRARHAAR